MPLEEQVKENKIFFNSNITVDMIKVSRNPDMSFNDFVASKNKVDAKTCLWNDFSSGVNANTVVIGIKRLNTIVKVIINDVNLFLIILSLLLF